VESMLALMLTSLKVVSIRGVCWR